MSDDTPSRLDRISTSWTLLAQARAEAGDAAATARRLLVERYRGAVRRYLGAMLRDDEAADDLTQEFGLALIEGKLGGATPERGRFRNYVKSVAVHMVAQYRKKQKRMPVQLHDEPGRAAADETEQTFVQSWRSELLARTWEALAQSHSTFFTVLHVRAVHPDSELEELIEGLNRQLGKKLTVDALRQTLRRARAMFADLLIVEVAQSLTEPTQDAIEEELGELNLLAYCQPALTRLRGHSDERA